MLKRSQFNQQQQQKKIIVYWDEKFSAPRHPCTYYFIGGCYYYIIMYINTDKIISLNFLSPQETVIRFMYITDDASHMITKAKLKQPITVYINTPHKILLFFVKSNLFLIHLWI